MEYIVFYEVGEFDSYAEIEKFDDSTELLDFINEMDKNGYYLKGCYRVLEEVKFKAVETVTKLEIDYS